MYVPAPPPPHENRVLWLALLAGLPAILATALLLWVDDHSNRLRWTLLTVLILWWLGFAFSVRERVVFPLRTLSNLLAALREGDYSLRARAAKSDALSEVMREVNLMGRMLREQRLSAVEATQLLRKVMEEIDVAVFTFDSESRLKLLNRSGCRLLGQPAERLLGLTAAELTLDDFLADHAAPAASREFPGGAGRWRVSRSVFFERGEPHRLVVISDVSRELRAEELAAWQRLVRVLSHELNNSLAPVKSLAGSLRLLLDKENVAAWEQDMREGLTVFESRVYGLTRFTTAYSQLAKLPPPRLEPVRIAESVRRAAKLETRLSVRLRPGPDVRLQADSVQLEQALINLLKNAADAALEAGGGVEAGWVAEPKRCVIWIADEGLGVSNEANLFVPFFTTKPLGTGIGLVLSRRIAESHGGTLTLSNREDRRGCVARLALPLDERRPSSETVSTRERPGLD